MISTINLPYSSPHAFPTCEAPFPLLASCTAVSSAHLRRRDLLEPCAEASFESMRTRADLPEPEEGCAERCAEPSLPSSPSRRWMIHFSRRAAGIYFKAPPPWIDGCEYPLVAWEGRRVSRRVELFAEPRVLTGPLHRQRPIPAFGRLAFL